MKKLSVLSVFAVIGAALGNGMDKIFPKSKNQLIPIEKPMPEVIKNNTCKPKRKPRKHNKKKRGY